MIITFTLITSLCVWLAWHNRGDRSMRIAFIAFALLNGLAGLTVIYEGNPMRWLPPDDSVGNFYRR